MAEPCDVLVVGAGPTGLALALWLTRLGARTRVVDKTSAPGTTSRALAIQARTLELYRQLDLAQAIVGRSHKVAGVNLWTGGTHRARIDFEGAGRGLTPFPELSIFPQDEHERLLIERLSAFGVAVERETELVAFADRGDRVSATLRRADGKAEAVDCAFLAGCDGARSTVRETLGLGFPGGAYVKVFYVADVVASGPPVDGELHVDLDEADFLGVFPLKDKRRVRLVGSVKDDKARSEALRFEDVSDRAIRNLKLKVEAVNWFSTYHIHHRVADRFRKGRVFLVGDAAHIHSPVGGQGMNTGIGDAVNLAWKLKAVLDRRAPDSLLDSFEAERIVFARKLVRTTDRAFSLVTAEGALADFIRLRIAPVVIPAVFLSEAAREFDFRMVSQIAISYRGGPLSEGKAGTVHGGDRLPWVATGDKDNHESLSAMRWQVHVYGSARPDLSGWRRTRGLPLCAFSWTDAHGAAGLARDALYLLRPDGYVALASELGPEDADRFLAARGLAA